MPTTPEPAESQIFRAISDPTRRRILDLLQAGERSVSELQAEFSISQPALSQHLKVLRQASLVGVRTEGRARIYSIRSEPLHGVSDWAAGFRRVWGRRFEPALGSSALDEEF